MKPSVCRMVHFVADQPGKEYHYAAVVTHVWTETCVNLQVFPKGSPMDERAAGTKTSVIYDESGTKPYSWHWPEREE